MRGSYALSIIRAFNLGLQATVAQAVVFSHVLHIFFTLDE